MRLPEFGVRFPITNLMIFSAVLVLSLFSLTRLGIDLMPEIEPPAISVITVCPGASPEDVEMRVTKVLENQLSTTPYLDKLQSRSMEETSVVTVRFLWGTNLDEASNDIRDRIELAKRFLPDIPDEIENPRIFKFNTAMIPIIFIGASARDSYPQLYRLIDKKIVDELKTVPGVGAVFMGGGLERQINIWVDRSKLEARNLSVQSVADAVARENITLPAGSLKMGLAEYLIRVPGEFENPAEMEDIIVGSTGGTAVYLKDVARVEDGFKEEEAKIRLSGERGLMILIQKQSGTNTVAVANRVRAKLKRIGKDLPPDVKLRVIFDTSEHIVLAINNLKDAVYWGGIFVVLVVYFFLRKIRPSLIIALTIPFSLLISFIFFYLFGYTINMISLSSLAIAIGMVVDNAIVVVDNVSRHRERGQRLKEAAIFGTSEVEMAVSASTFTTIVVFLPMMFLQGVVGIMFKQLAVVVTITLLASLFTALTFSPMLCSKLMVERPKGKRSPFYERFYNFSGRIFESWERMYAGVLGWALGHKKLTILLATAIFAGSLLLVPLIGTEFVPEEDTGDITVEAQLPVGTRVEETDKVARRIEGILEEVPERVEYYARSGAFPGGQGAAMGRSTGANICEVGAKLLKKTQRRRSIKEIAQQIRSKVQEIPGIVKLGVSSGDPFARILFGGGKAISVEIIGHSIERTNALAEEVKKILEATPGARDVTISRDIGAPELHIKVDRPKASALGLSMARITDSVKIFFYGKIASRYREAGDEYDIFVRLREEDRASLQDIENLPVVSMGGQDVKLSSVATIENKAGPLDIERLNQERIVKVEASTYRRSMGEVITDVKKELAKVTIPEDITINFGGEAEEQAKAFRDLFLLLLLGVALVYMVMAAQFESLIDPFVIMFSVPYAFTGVAVGLFITGMTINVISFLGLVMLVGIVVNNAIVLISYINVLRARGLSMLEAVKRGGADRLRPVLMTTITTLFGLLPLAVSSGEGSETWQPLGISILSGLAVSTVVTMIIVPTLYALFEEHIKKNNRKQGG